MRLFFLLSIYINTYFRIHKMVYRNRIVGPAKFFRNIFITEKHFYEYLILLAHTHTRARARNRLILSRCCGSSWIICRSVYLETFANTS